MFVQENAFENDVCDMASFLSRPQCVNCLIRHCRWIVTEIAYWNSVSLCLSAPRWAMYAEMAGDIKKFSMPDAMPRHVETDWNLFYLDFVETTSMETDIL